MRDVRHRRHVILHGSHAVLRQAVTGAFHDGIGTPSVTHLRQETLHVRRIGRRHVEARSPALPRECVRRPS